MKKIIISFTLIFCILLSAGCYMTQATKLRNIVGTYELTSYSDDGVDLLKEKQIVQYLVVSQSGMGYLYYKDSTTEPTLTQVQIRLVPDQEETNKYTYVEYKLDSAVDSVKLAYANKGLNADQIKFHYNPLTPYHVYTNYRRVSSDQDLSYLTKTFGELPTVIEYGKSLFHGFFGDSYRHDNLTDEERAIFNENFVEPYVYQYVHVNLPAQKATLYYMLKEDGVEMKEEFSIALSAHPNGGYYLDGFMTEGDRKAYLEKGVQMSGSNTYYAYVYLPRTFVHDGVTYEYYQVCMKLGSYFDLEESIADRVNHFNEIKQEGEGVES